MWMMGGWKDGRLPTHDAGNEVWSSTVSPLRGLLVVEPLLVWKSVHLVSLIPHASSSPRVQAKNNYVHEFGGASGSHDLKQPT